MADSVKVKSFVLLVKKYAAFLPVLLFLPVFYSEPSTKKIVLLSIVIVHYFLCFMAPIYLLKYFISKFELNQKFVDICSFISLSFMYIFSGYNWIKVFMDTADSLEFPAALFLIPFLSLTKVISVILFFTLLFVVYKYFKVEED